MSTSVAPPIAVPLGYTIVERIGAGGYGEVWKAIAPGGVEKAIKVVFGHFNEEFAERELKSLERIRTVRHPFLLSVERFDLVEGRLVIVTELADKSLSDLHKEFTEQGERGIPRDQLLSYLWDSADALDCLAERHSLQHLDVKPENILILGDHGIVADFGLVKKLTTRTLNSMMGGMTPVYSAPEIFDDNPSAQSDQYSLAIVYQQMLTGTLPFAGRTPAQLAKQHTQAAPDVGPLPPADQAIVCRALEKNPSQRFANCRAFVTALRDGNNPHKQSDERSALITTARHEQLKSAEDTHRMAALATQDTQHAQAIARARHSEQVAKPEQARRAEANIPELEYPPVSSEIIDVAIDRESHGDVSGDANQVVPTLVVGIGGFGTEMAMHIRRRIDSLPDGSVAKTVTSLLAIDVDSKSLQSLRRSGDGGLPMTTRHIPLRRPRQYRDASQDLLRWLSRRWLYNIPRSLETNGFRPLGRLALVDHADDVLRDLGASFRSLADSQSDTPTVRVLVLAGMSGGTGSGTAIDLAAATRSVGNDLGVAVDVHAILASTFEPTGNEMLAGANMYSFLTEIMHAQTHGNKGEHTPPGMASRFESRQRPFDTVNIVPIASRSQATEREFAFKSIAEFVTTMIEDRAPGVKQLCANSDTGFSLSTFACINTGELHDQHNSLGQTTTELADDLDEHAGMLKRIEELAEMRPLGCGYERASVFAMSANHDSTIDLAAIEQRFPSIARRTTSMPDSYLAVLGRKLPAVALAAQIADALPEVHAAASRLQTRSDIEWQDIRAVAAIGECEGQIAGG